VVKKKKQDNTYKYQTVYNRKFGTWEINFDIPAVYSRNKSITKKQIPEFPGFVEITFQK